MTLDFHQLTPVDLSLPNGGHVQMRPLVAGDRAGLAEGFERLSETSRYRRFMTPMIRLSQRELEYFSDLDYRDHFAWGVQVMTEHGPDGAGVARFVRMPADRRAADTAFTVLDDYQGMGIGQAMFRALAVAGVVMGIERFHFDVLADNRPMLAVLRKFDVPMDPVSDGLTHGVLHLGPFVESVVDWPPRDALAALVEAVATRR
jgi:GNAT superfamily N-acetyltransferase